MRARDALSGNRHEEFDMTDINTFTAPDELVARAKSGPHRGWDTFDLHLEGARMHLLHETVSAPEFDEGAAGTLLAELTAFAQGKGYGDADTYFHGLGGGTDNDDTVNEIHRAMVFDEPEEGDYFSEVRTSEKLLLAVAATDAARAFISPSRGVFMLSEAMLEAYGRGRDMKAAEVAPSLAPAL